MITIKNNTGKAGNTRVLLEDGTDITKDLGVYKIDITLEAGERVMIWPLGRKTQAFRLGI